MLKASLISVGAYVPQKILYNKDLEKIVDTSDEWIIKRTGIKARHIATDELTSDMGYKAALVALNRANIKATDLDAIICATITPDYFCMPSTACVIANKLGVNDITAFDISSACTGFVYLLEIAKSMIESGMKKNILIVGSEKLSQIVNWQDRGTCILFGDGAGAAIISNDENNYIIDTHTSSDGSKGDLLITPGFAIANPLSETNMNEGLNFIQMSGNEVFKIAVSTLTKDVVDILSKNDIKSTDIDLFVPHQANLRIIDAVKQRLNLKDEQCVVTVHKYGNTSSASIPMALNEAYEDGRLKKGSLVLLDAFGGGFTWGSAIFRFGGN